MKQHIMTWSLMAVAILLMLSFLVIPFNGQPALTPLFDSKYHEHTDHDHNMQDQSHEHLHNELVESNATVSIEVTADPHGGYNLHIMTTNFEFSPLDVNQPHVEGQGHAHLYVDGKKIARVYSSFFHFTQEGHTVEVTLNSNDHKTLANNGQPVMASADLDHAHEVSHEHHGQEHTHH